MIGALLGGAGLGVLVVVGLIVLVPLIWLIATYNRFVRLRQHIKESWADIDVELQRRYDLIPNLVATVQGYASHEREVFERVGELRARAAGNHGSQASQAVDETALMLELRRLFVVVEAYPQLRADSHFLALQKELSLTEDRIAASRRFYNANVRELKQLRETVPSSIVAGMFGVEDATFFELAGDAERVVPRVDLHGAG